MIALGAEGKGLHIAGAQAHEALPRLELKIDLISAVAAQAIDLIRRVHDRADAGSSQASVARLFSLAKTLPGAAMPQRDRGLSHAWIPSAVSRTLSGAGGAASTSGSDVNSMTLKPSGFQRRNRGSFEGCA